MPKVVVTGATGFIGRRLCQALMDDGDDVLALLRTPSTGPWGASVIHDLGTGSLPADAFADTKVIYHLASRVHHPEDRPDDDEPYHRVNVLGTHEILNAAQAAGVRRLVYVSSTKAMGENTLAIEDETSDPHPETPYGRTKLQAEQLVFKRDTGGPDGVVLRLPAVYGAGSKGNVATMLTQIARGRFPSLPEFGNQRSLVHVADVVQALRLAGRHPAASGRVYVVTSGEPVSTRGLYSAMCKAVGKAPARPIVPTGVFVLAARIGDVIQRLTGWQVPLDSATLRKLAGSAAYSRRRLCDELGFTPSYTLSRGLEEMVRARAGEQPNRW